MKHPYPLTNLAFIHLSPTPWDLPSALCSTSVVSSHSVRMAFAFISLSLDPPRPTLQNITLSVRFTYASPVTPRMDQSTVTQEGSPWTRKLSYSPQYPITCTFHFAQYPYMPPLITKFTI
uniref:Uncharacterized protein n=1 Tax=Picea glauca TaxID=3330 RepID=A0A124GNH7_PICGL|nr:hypothetical protein ABT39_MTgene4182 [Picea glauca]